MNPDQTLSLSRARAPGPAGGVAAGNGAWQGLWSAAMSLFDVPRWVLSNMPLIGGLWRRDTEEDDAVVIDRDNDPADDAPLDDDPGHDDPDGDDPADEAPEETETDESGESEDDESEDGDDSDSGDGSEDGDDEDGADEDGDDSGSGDGSEDISDVTAPSVGPHTTFEKDDPEERLARHDQSDVDAMGLDKRREVIGGSYSPSVGRQAATYGAVLGVVALIVAGFVFAANKLDQPPDKYEDVAPWSNESAQQNPPTEIDFPEYGHPGPGEEAESTPGEQGGAANSENVTGTETP